MSPFRFTPLNDPDWQTNPASLALLWEYLWARGEITPDEFGYLLEKPHKWTREMENLRALRSEEAA